MKPSVFFSVLLAVTLRLAEPLFAVAGNELPVSSPFFKPYEGDFLLELGMSYKIQSSTLTLPALSSTRETRTKESATGFALTYGIAEYFSMGVSGKYMADQNYSIAQSGIAFAGNPGTQSRNKGFYDPGFQLGIRALGTRTEEWFFNIDLGFVPGIKDSNNFLFSWPNDQYLAGLLVGKDFGQWSVGLISTAQYYAPSSLDKSDEKNNQLLSNNQMFVQLDCELLYIRLSGGTVKFLDKASNENAVKKKFFATGTAELGLPFSEQSALSARLTYVSGAEGELSVAGFNATLTAQPIWMVSLSVLTAF